MVRRFSSMVIGALMVGLVLPVSGARADPVPGPDAAELNLPIFSPYLSDLPWTAMTNGVGAVHKDERDTPADRQLSINGVGYAKGLAARAPSDVRYSIQSSSAVSGGCTTFNADLGVDDQAGGRGSVVFQLWGDGTKLYDSGVVKGGSAALHVSVNVTDKKELALVTADGGDGGDSDYADWANAGLLCSGMVEATVTRVIDGNSLDTYVFGRRTAVGYLGVQTPQLGQPCGQQAFDRNRELADGRVLLKADPKYQLNALGLALYYAYTPAGVSIDAVLIREGLGRAVNTDASLGSYMAALQLDAQLDHRGCLWQSHSQVGNKNG